MKTLAGLAAVGLIPIAALAQDGSRVRTTIFRGAEVQYEVVNGLAVYGDIILGTAEEVATWDGRGRGWENGRPSGRIRTAVPKGPPYCIWPRGIVPYVIDADVPSRERQELLAAVREWDDKTVLRFIPREPQHRDYVRFTFGTPGGSWSCDDVAGKGIGETRLQVEPNDSAGNLLHVIGHKIGLEHENQRRDRDRWLTVFRDNIAETPLARSAWHVKLSSGRDISPYDYRSIMHYWFIEPLKQRNHARPYAAETIPPGMPFGADVGPTPELSPGDVDSVARMYGHIPAEHVIATNPQALRSSWTGSA